MQQLRRFFTSPYTYIFIVSYYGVWLVWHYLKIPYTDPAHVISYLPSIHYNPENNVVRFLLAVLVPPAMCAIYWFIKNTKVVPRYFRHQYWISGLSVVLVAISILLALGTGIIQGSTYHRSNNPPDSYGNLHGIAPVDPFHEGETLGPAVSYEQPNLKPYKDFVIIHGVFQDPLRSVIAFKLFGTSIGAERAFATILFMLTGLVYYLLLLVLFRGNLIKSAAGMAVLALLILPISADLPFLHNFISSIQLPFRDIATMLFLIFAILGLRYKKAEKHKLTMLMGFLIGFVVVAGYANSLDRALYITVLAIAWLVMMFFLSKLKPFLRAILLPFIVGCALGIPVLGVALKWDFVDMLHYISIMIRYKGYLDGEIFVQPNLVVTSALVAIGILITVGALWLFTSVQARLKIRTFKGWLRALVQSIAVSIQKYDTYILLFFAGILFMDSAIDRADPGHLEYSVQWLYLLLLYILIVFLFTQFKKSSLALSFILIIFTCSTFGYLAGNIKHMNIRQDALPIHVSDKQVVQTDYMKTAEYLKSHLKDQDSFVTLTSEGVWYYLVNRPSPIKYPIVWYAFTAQQRQELADEIQDNSHIKYIVTNNNWTSSFDSIPNSVRFPEVYKVLHNHYKSETVIGEQTIWERI